MSLFSSGLIQLQKCSYFAPFAVTQSKQSFTLMYQLLCQCRFAAGSQAISRSRQTPLTRKNTAEEQNKELEGRNSGEKMITLTLLLKWPVARCMQTWAQITLGKQTPKRGNRPKKRGIRPKKGWVVLTKLPNFFTQIYVTFLPKPNFHFSAHFQCSCILV